MKREFRIANIVCVVWVCARVRACVLVITCNFGAYGGSSGYKVLIVRCDDSRDWWVVLENQKSLCCVLWLLSQGLAKKQSNFNLKVSDGSKS